MVRKSYLLIAVMGLGISLMAQIIPLDTSNWEFRGDYVLENFRGKDAIYVKRGGIVLKDRLFLNGTIEYDLFLKNDQMFPGAYFRVSDGNREEFYIRPHLSGKPDANQVAPSVNGIAPWQMMFGPKYSFPYEYKYDDWTHVKLVVNGDKAQVYLDYSEVPNHSWNLTLPVKEGGIALTGGNNVAIHIADVSIDPNATTLVDFNPIEKEPIENLVQEWEISDKFEESSLEEVQKLAQVINQRKWNKTLQIEEGTAANISRVEVRYDDNPGNTVFARLIVNSDIDQVRQFDFGYSDRVVAILNGQPIYRGDNGYRTRDYRYLGTIGLFDTIYLNLKQGENVLLFAVSEDFGGWLVTGRFRNDSGLSY